MQRLPPSGVWFVNCTSSVSRPGPPLPSCAHSDSALAVSPPQTGGPSTPRCPSRSPWQTLGSQTSAGLQTARRTARTATRPMAPPTERTDTTAVRPHIPEPQVWTRRVFPRVTSARARKYMLDDVAGSPAVGGSDSWTDRDIQYAQRALERVQLVHASVGTNRFKSRFCVFGNIISCSAL